jgi:hypothetical protein
MAQNNLNKMLKNKDIHNLCRMLLQSAKIRRCQTSKQ